MSKPDIKQIRNLNEQKFCSWCAGILEYPHESMSVCSQCGYKRFINATPTCSLIIKKGDAILMTMRNIQPQKGKVDLPGGFMDLADTSIEIATQRELFEELGLKKEQITALKYVGSATNPYNWMESWIHTVSFFFETELLVDETAIRVDLKENTKYIWVTKDDHDSIDFAWQSDKTMLKNYWGL